MKTLFDANVLLESLLQGRMSAQQATMALLRAEDATVSPLSVHLYVHFGKKENHNVAELLEDVKSYRILPMDAQTTLWAINNRQDTDFEDALQVGCAVLGGCQQLVTFDAQLAKNYARFIDIQLLA